MKHFAFLLFICLQFVFVFSNNAGGKNIYASHSAYINDSLPSQQLLIVITNGWDSLRGYVYCFEKRNGKWLQQFSNAVVVGSNGLGTGDGMMPFSVEGTPVKKEGDLRSPAGIFSIGTAFGYADSTDAKWIKNPYIKTTDTLICVDDPGSVQYNRLVNNDPSKSDWKSFEEMHRKDNYYQWGLFINHNAPKTTAGKGSCIFMHIWENDHTGTSGCTAMDEDNLLRILHWINANSHPMLVQIPKSAYAKLAQAYRLPLIKFK
jgi:L,D-peptidoglycan transpeptidase YkuD (ErfK/YbiS/YcfS/YnhG family)